MPPTAVAFHPPPAVHHKPHFRRTRDTPDDDVMAIDERLLQRWAATGVLVASELGHPAVVVEIEVVDDGGIVTATDDSPPVAAGRVLLALLQLPNHVEPQWIRCRWSLVRQHLLLFFAPSLVFHLLSIRTRLLKDSSYWRSNQDANHKDKKSREEYNSTPWFEL
ncbi:leptin receptor gene-related protein [Striga asiatica]|uniref:Leptin receptor gene-related protein n=1 Tax=Striga asiatica TaxID=4170 RepID=A0A5A7PDR1_STRAF|nr:leptin receptor gene-related protein [Striga asiatica]